MPALNQRPYTFYGPLILLAVDQVIDRFGVESHTSRAFEAIGEVSADEYSRLRVYFCSDLIKLASLLFHSAP